MSTAPRPLFKLLKLCENTVILGTLPQGTVHTTLHICRDQRKTEKSYRWIDSRLLSDFNGRLGGQSLDPRHQCVLIDRLRTRSTERLGPWERVCASLAPKLPKAFYLACNNKPPR